MRILNDWVLVELEEEASRITDAGIIQMGEDPVRMAKVLKVGPGKHLQKNGILQPSAVKPGERIAFFIAAIQTKQGAEVFHRLPDDQALIKESDILLVDEDGDAKVTR